MKLSIKNIGQVARRLLTPQKSIVIALLMVAILIGAQLPFRLVDKLREHRATGESASLGWLADAAVKSEQVQRQIHRSYKRAVHKLTRVQLAKIGRARKGVYAQALRSRPQPVKPAPASNEVVYAQARVIGIARDQPGFLLGQNPLQFL
jgi:hypothetical protein